MGFFSPFSLRSVSCQTKKILFSQFLISWSTSPSLQLQIQIMTDPCTWSVVNQESGRCARRHKCHYLSNVSRLSGVAFSFFSFVWWEPTINIIHVVLLPLQPQRLLSRCYTVLSCDLTASAEWMSKWKNWSHFNKLVNISAQSLAENPWSYCYVILPHPPWAQRTGFGWNILPLSAS